MAILCPQSEGEPPRDPLAQRLYALLPTDCRLVVVHASLADLRPPSGQGLWEVIAALLALTERGITIAVPTFTFAFCKSGRFDRWRTPGEVGILGNALLSVDGCLRTADPIYSHAVIGPLADQLCDWIGETAWGEGSIYDAFIHHDAVAIMLGCSWEACTPVHRCELLARVPYRLDKTFSGTLRDADSERAIAVNMFVRDLHIDARNSWAPLERRLRERGCINGFAWWSGTIECCRLRALQEHGLALLAEDPWALVANANIARKRASSLQAPQLTVLIAAMGNAMTR